MKQKAFKFLPLNLMMALVVLMLVPGCNLGGDKNKADESEVELDMSQLNEDLFQDIGEVKKIFYSLPSPLETAMMIRSAGAVFNEELLNSVDNSTNYTTNKSMALNLGVFTCDLSFASLYDQTEASIDYMNAAKKMADGLGILDAINDETIQELEENLNNRDKIMEIISETFMNSSSYLQENERASVAAIVLVGGWMEGLFLATQMVDADSIEDNSLVNRIMDQKLSLDIVLKLLEENVDNQDVRDILADVMDLKESFDKVTLTTTQIETSLDEETNVTTLKSKTTSSLNAEIFIELKGKIETIRTKYIS